jgi:hypothetical protein
VLKNRACFLNDGVLEAKLERFLEESKEARRLAACRGRLSRQVEMLGRVQEQFTQYVPFEWLADAGGEKAQDLLKPVPGPSASMSLETCQAAREEAGERADRLRTLSEVISSHHDVPALDPANQPSRREPASEEME